MAELEGAMVARVSEPDSIIVRDEAVQMIDRFYYMLAVRVLDEMLKDTTAARLVGSWHERWPSGGLAYVERAMQNYPNRMERRSADVASVTLSALRADDTTISEEIRAFNQGIRFLHGRIYEDIGTLLVKAFKKHYNWAGSSWR